ncbi:hypothetical protein PoB_001762400 [Plakobranchus ocellatus]|uniref:Uncharacterized protein n=1 Tax=Plakobranchus ocellatus TaxID=259542 RepID=A0AAV3ZAZ2_9GAST|nr:hypothetical protein PoB_001762400 [Plakobranchus ocellatus]
MLSYYYVEGRGRRLLAYRSCSSPNQVPLQRPVLNTPKARETSWAVIKERTVLYYSSGKRAGHARTPIFSLSRPLVPVRSNPRDVIFLRLVSRCADKLELTLLFASA